MTTLITGVTGFVGSHLAECLLEAGEVVVGLAQSDRWPLGSESLAARVPLATGDITDADFVRAVLREHRPDRIHHLAANSNVPESYRDPEANWRNNVDGSRRILEAALELVPGATYLQMSSGTVYGAPPESEMPITETTPLQPGTPYAESKVAADRFALECADSGGMRIMVIRPFNLLGPRQRSSFAVASFARQIAEFEVAKGPASLRVGRLDVERDFCDVRDAVRAFRDLANQAEPGIVVNVASGTTRSLESVLRALVGFADREVEIVQDPERLRPDDPKVVRVSPERLRQVTGWAPMVALPDTLRDTLDYWRRFVREVGTDA